MITIDQFRTLFPHNREPEPWVAAMADILPQYAIDPALRLAMFLAHCGHESCGFTILTENLNYSAVALLANWPRRFDQATARAYARQPERIANRVYANRMGNGPEESGDGWRFRGTGPLQITGRDNHTAFALSIGKTLEESEAYLLTPAGGIESACWFWTMRNLNPLADEGKIITATARINGGTNGLADRKLRYAQAKAVLAA